MLNLHDSLDDYYFYNLQTDWGLKLILFTFAVFAAILELRGEVSETNLLQLVPGVYIGIVFGSFVFLNWISFLLNRFTVQFDIEKAKGTKTLFQYESKLDLKSLGTLYSVGLYSAFGSIVPISLDSFDSYGEENLESIWSYDQFIQLETALIILVGLILHIPLTITSSFYSELQIECIPSYLKIYLFLLCIVAGVITPTVDAYTQLSFIVLGIMLYFLMNSILDKNSLRIFCL